MPTTSFLKGEKMQQPQLELTSRIEEKKQHTRNSRFHNAIYGEDKEYTAWLEYQLARPAKADTQGMFAKDILTMAKRTRLPRTYVQNAWGLNNGTLNHFLNSWDSPLTQKRQDVWLAGAHLLDKPPHAARKHILSQVGITEPPQPANGSAEPAKPETDHKTTLACRVSPDLAQDMRQRAKDEGITVSALIAQMLGSPTATPQPAWAQWMPWAGFSVGLVLGLTLVGLYGAVQWQ